MKETRATLIIIILLSITFPLHARFDSGGEFLTIGSGARPSGMGEVFSAVSGDINSINYNPAGLAALPNRSFTIEHNPLVTDLFNDMGYTFIGFGYPTEKYGSFALNLIYLASGEHTITDHTGQEVGSFKTSDYAITLYMPIVLLIICSQVLT